LPAPALAPALVPALLVPALSVAIPCRPAFSRERARIKACGPSAAAHSARDASASAVGMFILCFMFYVIFAARILAFQPEIQPEIPPSFF